MPDLLVDVFCAFLRNLLSNYSWGTSFFSGISALVAHRVRIRVKQVRFGKVAFLEHKGAFFGPNVCDFRPFRATFSVQKFGPLLCDFWSIGTFGSVRCVLCVFSTKTGVLGMIVLSARYP